MPNPGAPGSGKSDDDRTKRRYSPVVESFETREMLTTGAMAAVTVVAKKTPPPPPPPKVVSVDGVGIGMDSAKPTMIASAPNSNQESSNFRSTNSNFNATSGISLAVYELTS